VSIDNTKKILVTGAAGQIGIELTAALREKYGTENVMAIDIRETEVAKTGPFKICNILDLNKYKKIVNDNNIGTVYHLAAILSATGEKNPKLCFDINMNGLQNVLEVAREYNQKIFSPSSIAVFGPDVPKENTPQNVALNPTTVYGLTKVAGELLCDYYFNKYKVDIRGIRYPGLISWKNKPKGGTTDYAVEIYFGASQNEKYECFVNEETRLPMMYMPDAIRATLELMDAPLESLKHHSNYNLSGMSFSAAELAKSIQKVIPNFQCTFKPDSRQEIADSWPVSINDDAAKNEWGWKPTFDITTMTKDMLKNLRN
jgi:nucleoside-diphosphate-sugar epimerase|tara:strand:+ start:886 stop:1830 length:945 start_codon:yes stop_codon:yes gene_type:complete